MRVSGEPAGECADDQRSLPGKVMIGIWKVVTEGCDVYITPTMKEVEVLREIGSDIIAVDGTDRITATDAKPMS